MDDVHDNTRLPEQTYEAVDSWMLILLQYDVDRIVESLPESYLERLPSDPLNVSPLSDNPRRTVELLLLPLLIAG